MTDPHILESNIKPEAIEPLGNGTYYYNYNITEKVVEVEDLRTSEKHPETRWNFIQAYITGTPNYKDTVFAVIRLYMTADEEFALINKYNSYNFKIIEDDTVVSEYRDYCALTAKIKEQVKKDFGIV